MFNGSDLVNYSDLLGTEFTMNKEERLLSGDSLMTHAAVITGYNKVTEKSSVKDKDELNVDKWQVENSWSNKGPANGFYVMTDDWFNEYTFEVVVNKKYLNENHKKILEEEVPIELKPWDPMGSLAKLKFYFYISLIKKYYV